MRLRTQRPLSQTYRSHFVARIPGSDTVPAVGSRGGLYQCIMCPDCAAARASPRWCRSTALRGARQAPRTSFRRC